MSETHFQVNRLIEVQRYREARKLLETVFAEFPQDADAHVQAARIAYAEDRNDLAEEHLASALASNPLHYGARVMQHLVLVEELRYAEAEQVLLPLVREYPEDPELLAYYARLMMMTANLEKSRALVREALRLDPEHHQARIVNVLIATVDGEKQLANEQLSDLIRTDPQCHHVAYTLFTVLIDQNRNTEAFRVGQQLLRVAPDNQDLVEALVSLRTATHWLALPIYPLQRWGWAGSAGIWVGFIVMLGLLRSAPKAGGIFAIAYLCWVVYSWVYPPLMQRWLTWRGVH